jgi:hypothetical protein
MPQDRFDIGIVVARKTLRSSWADHIWLPHAALPAAPPVARWTRLGRTQGAEFFYAGACELQFQRSATAHYRDNLESGTPSLWIALTPADGGMCCVTAVTADPYEGEALTEGFGSVVEAVPMPPSLQAELHAFVSAFHVEQPFFKRERDPAGADPDAPRPVAAGMPVSKK